MSILGLKYLYQEELYTITGKVVVVIDKEWTSVSENEKALLAKILGSVKQSLESVQIINKTILSLNSLQFLSPSKILVFGTKLEDDLKPYESGALNGISVIKADALSELDDNRKKSLWLALRQMFGI